MAYRKFDEDVAQGLTDFNDDHLHILDETFCALGRVGVIFNSEREILFTAYDIEDHEYNSIDWAWATSPCGLEKAVGMYRDACDLVPNEYFTTEMKKLVIKTMGEGVASEALDRDDDIDYLWEMAVEFIKGNPELYEEEEYNNFMKEVE